MFKTLIISACAMFFCISCSYVSANEDKGAPACLTRNDLEKGIVVTSPANNIDLLERYRRLEGPFIGKNRINGVFRDRINISYAGLFTYKFWRNGKLVQYEKPTNDISELLKFQPGTTHQIKTVRINPSRPGKEFAENYQISIKAADDYILSGCAYSAVKLIYSGTRKGSKIFIPELMLDVTSNQWGDFHTIRKRNISDVQKWPFNKAAKEALNFPIILTKE